jgi:hypothetical protein
MRLADVTAKTFEGLEEFRASRTVEEGELGREVEPESWDGRIPGQGDYQTGPCYPKKEKK